MERQGVHQPLDKGFKHLLQSRMPWRLLQYMMEIWRNYLQNCQTLDKTTKSFRLPAIVPIVLYNGKQPWTAVRSFREYQTEPTIFGESLIDFCYELIDVHRYDETSLKVMKGLLPLIFQLEKAQFYSDYLKMIQAFMDSLKVLDDQDLSGFRTWLVKVVIPKLKDESNQRQLQEIANEIGGGDPMFVSNVTVLIEKEFRSVRRKGLKEGKKQGIELGKEQGIELGREQEHIELLSRIVANADKLGQPDEMIAAIAGITLEELRGIRDSLNSQVKKTEE